MKNAKFVFLDTAYVYALINTRDQWHERAVIWQATQYGKDGLACVDSGAEGIAIAAINYSRIINNIVRDVSYNGIHIKGSIGYVIII